MSDLSWPHLARKIRQDAISIGIAVAMYGVSFGALGTTTGLSLWQTQALSLLMFTGASQFALVGTLAAGGTALAAVLTSWLLGTRNAAYSLRMSEILNVKGPRLLLAAQLTIDESTAMALAQDPDIEAGRASRYGFWSTGISVFIFWNLATFLGAISAQAIGDPKALGLDAAIGAGLFALVWPQIKNREQVVVALGGALVAIIFTPVLTPGLPVLASAVVAFVIGKYAVGGDR
jgi:predicted branched-subunit amino acid permease